MKNGDALQQLPEEDPSYQKISVINIFAHKPDHKHVPAYQDNIDERAAGECRHHVKHGVDQVSGGI